MRVKSKLLSVSLSLALMTCLCPGLALAAEEESGESVFGVVGDESLAAGQPSTEELAPNEKNSSADAPLMAQASSSYGYCWPLKTAGKITQYYSWNQSSKSGHGGVDIAISNGTDVIAAKAGTVKYVHRYNAQTSLNDSTMNSYGNLVILYHPDSKTTTYYAHMKDVSVSVGQSVSQGQIVGHVGLTGATTGYHLHFELRTGATSSQSLSGQGTRQNPLNYVGSGNIHSPSAPTEKPPTPVYTGKVTTIPDGIYTVRCAAQPAYVLDIRDGSKDSKAQLQIWQYYKPTNAQKFRFTKNSDDTYKITNVGSGKVLDVADGSLLNHANVWQFDDNGSNAQRWYIEKNSDGSYSLRSKINNLYMDIYGGEIKNGTRITTYVGNYSTAQRFLLWTADVDNQVEGDVLSISGINASYSHTGKAVTPTPAVERVVYKNDALRIPSTGTSNADYSYYLTCWLTKGKTYTVDVGSLQKIAGSNTQASMALFDFSANKFLHEKRFNISTSKQTYTFTAPADGTLLFYAGTAGSGKGCATQWNNVVVREKLIANADYTCAYTNNVNPGTARLTVTLKGGFKQSKSKSYKIVASSASSSGVKTDATQSMYRLYNPNSGEHFYTANTSERDNLKRVGWVYEGVGWTAPKSSKTPVYRLYSGTDHHYTMDASERDMLKRAGWRYEGIGWYSDDAKGVPLYRQFNPNVQPSAPRNNSGSHNYTKDKSEHNRLVAIGWKGEGVGWYGVK